MSEMMTISAARRPDESASPDESREERDGENATLLDAYSAAVTRAVRIAAPAVVKIDAVRTARGRRRQGGSGSGFVFASDGLVLTNAHVAAGADELAVMLPDGRACEASVLGADEDTDLAVLKVSGPAFAAIPLGQSRRLQQGQLVV